MASVAMETRMGVVEEVSRKPAATNGNGDYQPLEPGKVSGLHIPEIEAVADRLAKELDFKPGDDLHNVVQKLGGELRIYEASFEEPRFSGTLVGKEFGSFRILVPARSSLPQENVVIAKELGHYFLHHLYSRAKVAPEASDDNGEPVDPIALSNSEAEVFALCFLMPKARFRRDINTHDPASLAARYALPETIVRKREELLRGGNGRG